MGDNWSGTYPHEQREHELRAELSRLRAENAALSAQLAEARARIDRYEDASMEMDAALRERLHDEVARAEQAESALVAAHDRIEHMSSVLIDAESLLGVEETGELILRPIERLIACEAAANARIGELETIISELRELANASAVRRDAAEKDMERAEAEADSLRNTIDNMRAMNIKLTFESTGKVLAAEAKCVALREVLARIERESIDDVARVEARTALATSPAAAPVGREG